MLFVCDKFQKQNFSKKNLRISQLDFHSMADLENIVRRLVSKEKKRFQRDGFDVSLFFVKFIKAQRYYSSSSLLMIRSVFCNYIYTLLTLISFLLV
jgi:hypothetical protein